MTERVLFSCMRDEAPYALEWVAYHRLIGFDRIVICTNACSDGTIELLDALATIGWVERIDNPTPEGVSPQIHASARIGESPRWSDGDWVMWLDTDEFLNIQIGGGLLDDLIAHLGDADGYAVHWRLFGDGGQNGWTDRPVTDRFRMCGKPRADLHEPVKTLFRWSPSVEALHTHRPVLRPSFRERGRRWLHGAGTSVPEVFYYHRYNTDSSPALRLPWVPGRFAWAQVNHYAVRSRAEYILKQMRGSGMFQWTRHNDAYWQLYNLNDRRDDTIARHMPGLIDLMGLAKRDPAVASAVRMGIDRLRERLAQASAAGAGKS